jgi:chromosome segregation ATPase
MREEIVSTVQQAVTARHLPAAQLEQMKQLGTSASQWLQEAAKSGLTLTECETTAKQLADAQAKIRAFPKPDPKLAECRAKLAPARDQIAATIKKVMDAGNPSPAHLEEMKRMGEASALLLQEAQKDGFSLADCEAAAKRLADQQARANQFALLGAQLAQCRTTANATYQEMTKLFQQAQTSKTVNPRESFQLQRSRQNVERTLAEVRKDGITLEDCQQNIAMLNNEMGIIREAMRPDIDVCRQSLNGLDGQLRTAVDKLKAMRQQIANIEQAQRADAIIFDHQICCFTSPGEAIPLPACRARLDQTERVWERIRTQFPNTAY